MIFSIDPPFVKIRSPLLGLLLALMCGIGRPAPALWAQTAHFAGMVRTLGSGGPLHPVGVAVDGSGDLFVADATDNAIKEMVAVNGSIPASPTILTVGSGFNHPEGVAVDGNGNIFVADQFNNAIKQIMAGTGGAAVGTVNSASTVRSLGSGFNRPEGLAVDGNGNVFVADLGNNVVKEIVAVGGSIPASPTIRTVGAGFSQPTAVAVDGSGNVFVADTLNNAVKQIMAGTGGAAAGTVNSSSTVTSLGNGFSEPDGVAVDGSGNVFVADFENNAVKEIIAVNGGIPASPAINSLGGGFSLPNGVAVDASGNVFVADYNDDAVLEIGPANFGTFAVGATSLQQSLSFNFDTPGTLFYTPFVVLTMGAANLDFRTAASQPSTVCVAGHTYYAGDTCTVDATFNPTRVGERRGAVQLMGSGGVPIATGYVRGVGTGPQVIFPGNNTPVALGSTFLSPTGVAVDGSGNVFVADSGNGQVKEMMAVNGSIPATPVIRILGSGFSPIDGVAVDGSGNVFVADINNNAVKEIVAVNGSIPALPIIRTLGSGFNHPFGVAVDGSGNVFVAGNADMNVTEIVAVNGTIPASPTLRILGSGFNYPLAVAVDSSGNVFVGDWGSNALKEIVAVNGTIPASPTIRTWTGGFSVPLGLAVDPLGNVFIGDAYNNAVKVMLAVNGTLPASPIMLTLGSGFAHPTGLTVDPSGNVFVADFANNAVKELPFATVPSLNFATTPVGSTSIDSPQTVTVANDGNADLMFAVPATGLNPSLSNTSFVLDSGSSCPQLDASSSAATLAPGASCTYQVSFSPTVAGSSITGSLAIVDNNLNAAAPNNATQAIALTGSANAAAPGAPIIGSATAGNTQATVSFTPPSTTGGATITSYTATSIPGGLTGTCAASPCTVTGLTNGTAYSFTVTATNSVGTGPASAGSNSVTLLASQTITFNNPGTQSFGASPRLVATATSALAVTFTSSTTGVCTITSGGTLATISAGTCTIDANQAGSATYLAAPQVSQSFGITALVPQAPTIGAATAGNALATVSFTPPSSTGGATITSYTATSIPGGLTGTCAASPCMVTGLTSGTAYSFTVTATNSAGTSAASAQTNSITLQSTQTITFPPPAPPVYYSGVPVTLAATASSGLTVSYTVTGPASIGGSTLTLTGAGTVVVTASQSGNASYSAATPVSATILVQPAPTTTSLTTSASAITAGQSLTLVATVLAAAAPVSSGMVTFSNGTASIGTAALNAQGVASFAITTLPVGTDTLTATYAATTNYAGSTSSAQIVTVAATELLPAATTTSLTTSASAITAGQSLTLAATVLAGAAPVSSGTVTFSNGTTSIGTAALNAQGVASFAITTLPVGTDTLTATYAATTNYAGSTSSAQIVTVAATVPLIPVPSYSMTASPTSLNIVQGQTGATTLTITPAGGFTGTLTLSCGNLPAFATCAFAQNSITLTGNNQPVQVGLTLATNVHQPQLASSRGPAPLNPLLPAMVFLLPAGIAGLAIGDKRKCSPKLRRCLQLCLLLVATGTAAAGMIGCNTGTPWTTPVGTTNVVIVGTTASGNGQSLTMSVTITQ